MGLKGNLKFIFLLLALSALMFLMSACGNTNQQTEGEQSKTTKENQTVTIKNMDRTITFTEVPKRAVTLNQHATEVMLALELDEYMVGTAYLDDEILPEYKERYDKLPVLSDKYPSQEVFLSVEPDFTYAGWGSAFREDNVGTFEQLEQFGVKAYLHQSSTIVGPTIKDVFADILNIGRIFNVEERAEQLISSLKTDLEAVGSKIGEVSEPLRVFVYDSGEDTPFTVSKGFATNIITMAGGKNIFDDINKNWAQVSWEEIVNRDPEVIVIVDYGDVSAEDKKNFLLNNPALKNVSAIKKQKFVILPLSAAAEGVRIVSALEILAKGFYPEKFSN